MSEETGDQLRLQAFIKDLWSYENGESFARERRLSKRVETGDLVEKEENQNSKMFSVYEILS